MITDSLNGFWWSRTAEWLRRPANLSHEPALRTLFAPAFTYTVCAGIQEMRFSPKITVWESGAGGKGYRMAFAYRGLSTTSSPAQAIHADLVAAYGTPLYVYQLDAVRRAGRELLKVLPDGIRLFYSAKANPHPRVIAAAAAMGLDIEVSSVGELSAAARAGAPLERTLYTGPGKTAEEQAAAVRSGVDLFSVESRTERDRLATVANRPVDYLIRLNPTGPRAATGLRMTGTPSQFGVDPAELRPAVEAGQSGLLEPAGPARPVGFHVFSATNVADEQALLTELAANIQAVAELARHTGFSPSIVDIGGGFGAPYMAPGEYPAYPTLRTELAMLLDAAFPEWRAAAPTIAVESGRYLVAASGTLLTTVLDVKSSGQRTFIVCDAGVNVLGGMYGTGRLVQPKAQPIGQSSNAPAAALAGPLCTPLDILNRAAHIDERRVGTVLTIPNVGAYGLTASLVAFLSRPMPVEVVLDGDRLVDVRRLELTSRPLGPTVPTL